MTENVKLQVGYKDAAEMLEPQSVTQIVIAALRNVVGLSLGAAMDDGRFDARTAMILAEGIQVQVGEQTFWVNVFQHGDDQVQHLAAAAVKAAAEECESEAVRLEARMPDGSYVWKNGDVLAQGARHCAMYVRAMAPSKPYAFINELEKLRKRDARWRSAVGKLLMMEPGLRDVIGQLARADVAELTSEGREARAWAAELVELMKRP